MGTRKEPLRFVCLSCGKECETYSTSKKGMFCSKQCRADHDRKGQEQPRCYQQNGYWMLCWTVPGGTKYRPKRKHQFEHRRVWEDAHGPIPAGMFIHHVNGDKLDNRLENLELLSKKDHMQLHAARGDFRRSDETRRRISRAQQRVWAAKRKMAS